MGYLIDVKITFEDLEKYNDTEISTFITDAYEECDFKYFTSDYSFFKEEIIKNKKVYFYSVKWYEIKEDLEKLSKMYPKLKITAEVEGEERDDYRKIYATKGKIEVCQAVVSVVFPKRTLW